MASHLHDLEPGILHQPGDPLSLGEVYILPTTGDECRMHHASHLVGGIGPVDVSGQRAARLLLVPVLEPAAVDIHCRQASSIAQALGFGVAVALQLLIDWLIEGYIEQREAGSEAVWVPKREARRRTRAVGDTADHRAVDFEMIEQRLRDHPRTVAKS